MSDSDVVDLVSGIVNRKSELDNQMKAETLIQKANDKINKFSGGSTTSEYDDLFIGGKDPSKPDLITHICKYFNDVFRIEPKKGNF